MLRRLLIAPLAIGMLLMAAVGSASAITPVSGQGPVNGKHCGQPVGFALVGGTPAEVVTTNENQQVLVLAGKKPGTFTETTCADLLPSTAQTSKLIGVKIGACLQFNPTAPAGSPLIAGTNALIVIGKLVGPGGIYSGTCRTFIPKA